MKKIILLFIVFYGFGLMAQSDDIETYTTYVVKTNGDTIYGKLKYKSGENIKTKITVKVSDTLKYNFKADEISYFWDGKNEYITFVPEGEEESFFLKIWVKGYFTLYEWQIPADGGGRVEYIPYIRKDGESEMIDLGGSYWKKILAELFEDYEELSDKLWKGKFKMDEMDAAVIAYNEWRAGD